MGVNGEAPAFGGGFFLLYELIVADWVELICKPYWFVFKEIGCLGLDKRICWVFWGTSYFRFFRGAEEGNSAFRPFDFAQGSTPAFGRGEAPLRGALFTARLQPCLKQDGRFIGRI